jgi:multisubunit Na+/H+ antiporter MnhF subunit
MIKKKLEAIKAKRNQRRVVKGNTKQTRIIVLEICTRSLTVKISYLEFLISNSDI